MFGNCHTVYWLYDKLSLICSILLLLLKHMSASNVCPTIWFNRMVLIYLYQACVFAVVCVSLYKKKTLRTNKKLGIYDRLRKNSSVQGQYNRFKARIRMKEARTRRTARYKASTTVSERARMKEARTRRTARYKASTTVSERACMKEARTWRTAWYKASTIVSEPAYMKDSTTRKNNSVQG